MLQAKSVHGEQTLVEMVVFCAHPFFPEEGVSQLPRPGHLPFVQKVNSGNQPDDQSEYFCEWHQFSVIVKRCGDFIELYPEWACYREDVPAKEKAIAALHPLFTYHDRRNP